ncbi:UNVERIFIED_CONTAM: hypothetical protein RMT77_014640 [Armadillidium vulgare]
MKDSLKLVDPWPIKPEQFTKMGYLWPCFLYWIYCFAGYFNIQTNFMEVILSRYNFETILDWCYGGVNATIPGNGGPDCANFLSFKRRILETLFGCIISLIYFLGGWFYITYPASFRTVR